MRTLFLIFLSVVSFNCFAQTVQTQLDSLLEVGKKLHIDKKFVAATEVFRELINRSKENKNPLELASFYYDIGRFYDKQQIQSKALTYLFDGIAVLGGKQPQTRSNPFYVINPNQDANWGVPYLSEAERAKGAQLLADIYIRIGSCYYNQEDYEKADVYWLKALTFAQANDCQKAISGALSNLGEILRIREDYSGALALYKQAIEIKETIGDSIGMAIVLANLGISHLQLGQMDSSKMYYDEGLRLSNFLGFSFLKMGFYENYGLYYYTIKDNKKAIAAYKKGLGFAKEENDKVFILTIYQELTKIYEEEKMLDSAMLYQKEWITLNREVTQQKKEKLALEIEAEYLISEKEKELNFLKEKTKIANQNTQLNTRLQLGFIIGLMVLLAFAGFILYARNRHNKRLEDNIKQINQQNEEKDILLKEIHHRVKNNLQVITGLLSLQSYDIEDAKTKELFSNSQYRINSMAMIHEMLYQSNDLSRIDYKSYLSQLVDSLIISIKGRGHQIKVNLEVPSIYLNIDTSIPLGLLINEVITNSLKYGFPNNEAGTLTITMKILKLPHFLLEIGDDGIGYEENKNFQNMNSLGLRLIKKLTLQLNGKINRDYTKKGTHYVLEFEEVPVNQPN